MGFLDSQAEKGNLVIRVNEEILAKAAHPVKLVSLAQTAFEVRDLIFNCLTVKNYNI